MDYQSPEPENEMLQCCDESGNPTFGKTRTEIHAQPINFWHLTTGIYVVNPEGRILCPPKAICHLPLANGFWRTRKI